MRKYKITGFWNAKAGPALVGSPCDGMITHGGDWLTAEDALERVKASAINWLPTKVIEIGGHRQQV